MSKTNSDREVVLVVDDNNISLEIAAHALCDYTVHTAESGKKMFELISQEAPSLILLDILLSDTDGWALIKTLKSDEETENIPVIFLTEENDMESELRALQEGAVDYIKKPFFPEILKKRVELQLLLQRQKREIIDASDAKTEFIAIMSHEMRTPLNAIIGLSEMSLETPGTNHAKLLNIKRAGTTLLDIIDDLLDVSKIESGKFEFVESEYDTANMINDAVAQSVLFRNEKDIKFILTMCKNFPAKLYGDELRVKQILNNLLSNAFKYTKEGSVELKIALTREQNSAWVSFVVKDTGIGIKDDSLGSVFDAYTQADMGANRKIMGTGLGLPIAQKLSKMMDGEIIAESEYGKGSTFSVTVRQLFVDLDTISPRVVRSLQNLHYSEEQKTEESYPRLNLSHARVLVVDDIDVNLEVAAGVLKRYGIKTDCARSGKEAIQMLTNNETHYDAIFMDHIMPEMDGIEAVHHIKKIETARDIPIIALTANAIAGNEDMFLSFGFQGYLSKPVKRNQLDAILMKWVAGDNKNIEVLNKEEKISEIDFKADGIDLNKGVQKFGEVDIYLGILRIFMKNIPSVLEKARDGIVDENDVSDYITAVHGIRGSCYGICAEETAYIAGILEEAAKTNKLEVIYALNTAFVHYMERLFDSVEKVIECLMTYKQKKQAEVLSSQLLAELVGACKCNDINRIDGIVTELNEYQYNNDGDNDLVLWLRAAVDSMDYADVIKKLEGENHC
ncbi:MAG: response regulator [Defluviitaleaceae bacterium]|nr:response regulator [Defluviitaleaceae bacterium]